MIIYSFAINVINSKRRPKIVWKPHGKYNFDRKIQTVIPKLNLIEKL